MLKSGESLDFPKLFRTFALVIERQTPNAKITTN